MSPDEYERALDGTAQVLDALAAPDAHAAYSAVMAEIGSGFGPLMVVLTRLAALPYVPGREVFAADEAAAWAPMAISMIDAGMTGEEQAILLRLKTALASQDDADLGEVVWHLAQRARTVMDAAGGLGAFTRIARLHASGYRGTDAVPREQELLEPAALIAATVAAGHLGLARDYLSNIAATDSKTLPALLWIWLRLAAGSGTMPTSGALLRLDDAGIPEAFADRDTESAHTLTLAGDIVAAMAAGQREELPALLARLRALDPGSRAVMAWQLAVNIGYHLAHSASS
jgi:hypothetical protein